MVSNRSSVIKTTARTLTPHQKFALAEAVYLGAKPEQLAAALTDVLSASKLGEVVGFTKVIAREMEKATQEKREPVVNEKWGDSLHRILEAPDAADEISLTARKIAAPLAGKKRILSWTQLTSRMASRI
jgi:hypothetical protein